MGQRVLKPNPIPFLMSSRIFRPPEMDRRIVAITITMPIMNTRSESFFVFLTARTSTFWPKMEDVIPRKNIMRP